MASVLLATRLNAPQMPDEEILSTSSGIRRFADAVTATRNDEQIEIFVRFDQRVDDLHCRCGIDIAIQFADGQQ